MLLRKIQACALSLALCLGMVPSVGLAEEITQSGQAGESTEVVTPDTQMESTDVTQPQGEPTQQTDPTEMPAQEETSVVQEGQGKQASQEENQSELSAQDEAVEMQEESVPKVNVQETSAETVEVVTSKDEKAGNDEIAIQKETPVPTITYQGHVQKIGWQKEATNGGVCGTSGRGLRVEAIKISLPQGIDGGITYRAHVQRVGWQGWKSNGEMAGTSGRALRVEALQIKLTGNIAKSYDVWYRAHVQKVGWQAWVKNGDTAGTSGRALRVEALQIVMMPKGASAPAGGETEPATGSDFVSKGSITYRASVGDMGWLGWVSDGDRAGTFASNTWMDGMVAELSGSKLSNGDLHYSAYMQDAGWLDEVTGSKNAGNPGSGKRLQAVRMRLTGTSGQLFDIYYRTYVNGEGWLKWAKNNEKAGFVDTNKGVQVVEVKLVGKGGTAPSSEGAKSYTYSGLPELTYRGHVQKIGWQNWVGEGETAGTSGRALRVEALQAKVAGTGYSGEIQMRAHVQKIGWQNWVGQGKTAGTTGRALRVEAIQVRLTGDLGKKYDVYYRVHAQRYGWMGWAANGNSAGTSGLAYRLEAVEIRLVTKGGSAPGSTDNAFVNGADIGKTGYQNPLGYYQVSSKNVKIPSAATYPFNYVTPSRITKSASRTDCVNAFLQRARDYLGAPYKKGYACAPSVGVDSAGLVIQCAYACGMDLGGGTGDNDFNPWTHYVDANGLHGHDERNLWNSSKAKHVPYSQSKPGDLIYWPDHLAIYMGAGSIIEAYNSSTGVRQASLSRRATPTGCIRLFQ